MFRSIEKGLTFQDQPRIIILTLTTLPGSTIKSIYLPVNNNFPSIREDCSECIVVTSYPVNQWKALTEFYAYRFVFMGSCWFHSKDDVAGFLSSNYISPSAVF